MLPKKNRLRQKKDFTRIRQEGKSYNSPLFGLLVLHRGDDEPSRFGFVLSTRLSKKATERNRARRVIKEAVRSLLPGTKKGFDVVFLGKKVLLKEKTKVVFEESQKTFRKAGLLG